MEHEIIQDLLPLYHDGVCSEQSRAAVEEHLETCEACRKALADMDAPLPETAKRAVADAAVVKGISTEWKTSKRMARLKGIVIGLVICVLVAGGAWFLNTWTCIPVDRSECAVQLYQLEDGSVGVHWTLLNATWTCLTWEDREDGRHWYMERPILWTTVFNFDHKSYNRTRDALFDSADGAVYLDLGEESILLMEDGQPAPGIPAAAPEQAALWGNSPIVTEE